MSFLKDNDGFESDGTAVLEVFAAELTVAAYPVALRHCVGGNWIDLELDLWREMAETVAKWDRVARRVRSSHEYEMWREGLLAELVSAACHTTLRHGASGSVRESLDRAFRSAIGRKVRGFRRSSR